MEEGERRKFQAFLEERAEARERGERPFRDRLEQLSPESREKLAPLVRRWRGMGPARAPQDAPAPRALPHPLARRPAGADRQEVSRKSPEERARILESLREASKALPPRPLFDAEPEQIAPAPEE